MYLSVCLCVSVCASVSSNVDFNETDSTEAFSSLLPVHNSRLITKEYIKVSLVYVYTGLDCECAISLVASPF